MSTSSKFIPIELNPGINRDTTSYGSEGNWYSMDKVRFKSGKPQSFGGWQKYSPNQFEGIARYATNWATLDTLHTYVGLGTHSKMYISEGGNFFDITPVSTSISVSSALTVTSGETSVIVSVNLHDRVEGDYVKLTAGATVGGSILIDDSYKITSVIDSNTFVINSGVTATGGTTSGGATATGYFPIHSGFQSDNLSDGWGRGSYGEGAWSAGVSAGLIRKLRKWSGDNWGEDLVFVYKGGPLYWWDATNGVNTPATQVSAAPEINDYINVTFPTRHLMSFGTVDYATSTYDPMLIRWSTDENFTDWIPSGTNTAGDYRIQDGSKIMGVQETKAETLIWTDTALYSTKYTGDPYYFSFDVLGKNCGLISQTGSVDVGGVIYWIGPKGFYLYNGTVSPLACPITKDIFEPSGDFSIDFSQKDKIYTGHNSLYKEVIWLYQGVDSTTNECNRYVIYNYESNLFYYGTLDRSCWLDVGLLSNPLGFGTDNYVYTHELGLNADNDPLDSYIESAPFDISEGDELMFVDRIVPDFKLVGSLGITLNFQKFPGSSVETKGPYTIVEGTERVDTRGRGRQMSIRVGTSALGSSWQLGKMRVRVKTNGRA